MRYCPWPPAVSIFAIQAGARDCQPPARFLRLGCPLCAARTFRGVSFLAPNALRALRPLNSIGGMIQTHREGVMRDEESALDSTVVMEARIFSSRNAADVP